MSINDVRYIELDEREYEIVKQIEIITPEGLGGGIPFKIKRVFYMFGSDKDVVRGRHANRKSEFVLINVSGSSKVKVDDGKQTKIFELNAPNRGLYIPKMIWKDMYDFSKNSVLLVLANECYDPFEYIRDYSEFLKRACADNLFLLH